MAEPYTGPNLGPLQSDWSAVADPVQSSSWGDHADLVGTSMDTAKDIAKSAGIGVAKGTLGLAGAAGDLSNLLAKGSQAATNFIAEKTGLDPGPQAGETMLPTSASLQKNVEGVTGDFYKPQTTPGHYAETVGEFLPAAVAGPGGVAGRNSPTVSA